MKPMNAMVVSLMALALVAGCDSKKAEQDKVAAEWKKNAQEYKADYGDSKPLYNPDSLLKKKKDGAKDYADAKALGYGNGRPLFDPDSLLKKKDEANK